MSEKTLDNTKISHEDEKEIIDINNKKLDNTSNDSKKPSSNSNSSRSRPSRSKSSASKSKKDDISTDSSDSSAAHEGTVPKDAAAPSKTSLQNIHGKLSDPKIKKEFIINVADLIGQYSRRKLTDEEFKTLEKSVDNELLASLFKVKKLD